MLYFSDDFNFKESNFPELYKFINDNNIKYEYDKLDKKVKMELEYTYHNIDIITDEIYSEEYMGINLFNTYLNELLYYCSTNGSWHLYDIPKEEKKLCTFLYNNYKKELLSAREKSIFFIKYWNNIISNKKISVGISFGGNLIYANSYAKILKTKNIHHFCIESFFTGNDFYFEHRYSPLPNNSILKNNTYCKSLFKCVNNKNKKFIKLNNEKNKNVKQPAYFSPKDHGYILIIAQVRNDFSIFSNANIYKNSIKFYLNIISKILENTDYKIILKTHPYEVKKCNNPSLTTFSIISHALSKVKSAENRVSIYEDFSLMSLIDNASMIITLNSQGGLQAVSRFKPVVCFGGAFYGHKGFTYDYLNIDDFIKDIPQIEFTLDNYINYLNFMDATFEHLIGINEEEKLGEIFVKSKLLSTYTLKKTVVIPKRRERLWRKLKKLLRSPVKFIKDSKIFVNLSNTTEQI